MKASDFRAKTEAELKEDLKSFQRERMNLRFQKAAKEGFSGSRSKLVRKAIARIKTILSELKQRGGNA
jgi:large subunit ribosomal protein L29